MSIHSAVSRLPGNYTVGMDSFSPSPGTRKSMNCLVCNAKMRVKRNVNGPTSSVGAMFGRKHKHDRFTCPNSGTDWHNQVIDLRMAINETPSRFAAEQMEKEIGFILKDRKPTLKKYTEGIKSAEKFEKAHGGFFEAMRKKANKPKKTRLKKTKTETDAFLR